MRSHRKPLGRALLMGAAVIVALTGIGRAGSETAAPTITLLGPAKGSTVAIKPGQNITFRLDVKWPTPPTGTIVMSRQMATDAGFTQVVSSENHACTVQQGGNCW